MNYITPPNELTPGSRVCCYLRDSGSDSQEQGIDHQRIVLEEYCAKYGFILTHIFEDKACKGGTAKNRTAFLEMIDLTQSPERPDGILVWNYARFARNMDDLTFYRMMIAKSGMVFHSLTDPIARVQNFFIDFIIEEQRKQISEDVKRALEFRVRNGYTSGGPVPRGYKTKHEKIGIRHNGQNRLGTKLEIDPELGPLVELAFNMRADEKSYTEIMQATRGKLYKTKNCLRAFFANKTYLGVGKCGGIEVENHHPALVDQATWDAVQDVQKRFQHRAKGGQSNHTIERQPT